MGAIAKMIRSRYPGDYDDLSDAELERLVAKSPGKVRLQLARAQMEESVRPGEASAQPMPGDPAFYGNPEDLQSIIEAARHRGAVDSAVPNVMILGSAASMGLVPAAVAMRAGGAAMGATEGYHQGGVPGALAGGVVGAVKPGATSVASGAIQGYRYAGVPGALVGAGLGRLFGGPVRGSATAAKSEAAAVLSEAKQETIAASRALRDAKAAEAVAAKAAKAAKAEAEAAAATKAGTPKAEPPKAEPWKSERGESYSDWLARMKQERTARLAQYDAEQAAARETQVASTPPAAAAPEPPMLSDDAVAVVTEPIPFRPRRQPMQGIVTVPPGPRGAPAVARVIEAEIPPQAAVAAKSEVTAQAEEIAGKIIQWRTESKLSGAQMVSSLRNVYGIPPKDGQKMVDAVLEANGLRVPRIQIGAERVGRQIGMTKEEVRRQTGPILDEAVGQASPVLPQQAISSIAEKIKTLPRGPARDAYVRAATSGKAMWNVEVVRRTLESQGLGFLLPAFIAGGAVSVSTKSE